MTFDELVIFYIMLLDCTAKELTIESGLANGTISRYIHALRTPTANSSTVPMIAGGISSLAAKKSITLRSEDIVKAMFAASETDESPEHSVFRKNLRKLIDYMGMSINSVGTALNYDPSYISRLLAGQRQPYNLEELKLNTAKYFARYASHQEEIICKLASLYQCTPFEAGTDRKMTEQTYRWLSADHGTVHSDSPIGSFLDKLDEFSIGSFRESLHMDCIKLPTLSEPRIIHKKYSELSSMKAAELDYIRHTEMTCTAGTAVMYCDMPLDTQSSDPSFVRNWTFGICTLIERGVTFRMIHNAYRPSSELISELELYIPLYMTGAVTPYCLRKPQTTSSLHLLHVSDTSALSGTAKAEDLSEGKFLLTSKPDSITLYRSKANILIRKSKPLIRIYTSERSHSYISLLKKCASLDISSVLYTTMPIFLMSQTLLTEILSRTAVSEDEANIIYRYRDIYSEIIRGLPESCTVSVKIPVIKKPTRSKDVMPLFLADIFLSTEITLNYEEYTRFVEDSKQLAEKMPNLRLIYEETSPFKNISLCIVKDKIAVISKRADPQIHLVTDNAELMAALAEFCGA